LVYGRFSRPSARLLFSNHALIAPYKEGSSLQFRIVNRRKNVLLEMEARVMLMAADLSDESSFRKYYNLRLETPNIHFFPITWTLVHSIDERSPLFGILILIKGYDETFGQNVHVRFSYKWDEIIWGAKFIRNYHTSEDGSIEVHIDQVHNYEILPGNSAT
jgi:inward rectifier potassium channel